jgi:uncharacterized YigZ family protein
MAYYYLKNKDTTYIAKFGEISSYTIVEKKSKFLSYIFNISNNEMALDYISKISNEYKDARHIVYIYSYLENNVLNIRFFDDGEPQGTGTKAIYDMLLKEQITNICIVIVRYFGGILLGAGPLSRTYLNSAREAIGECNKEILYNYTFKTFYLNYSNYDILINFLQKYIKESLVIIQETKFNEKIELILKIENMTMKDINEKIEELIK